MKKFTFSLQKVLEFRENTKKQAEVEFGKSMAEENRIQQTLDMIAQQQVNTMAASNGSTDISYIYGVNNYLNLLNQRKEQLLEELTQAHMITEQKREIMIDASREFKVMEKLKENQFEQWQKETKKAQEKELDDINNARLAR